VTLDELLRGEVAEWVLTCVIRDSARRHASGKPQLPYAPAVIAALSTAAGRPLVVLRSDSGTPLATVEHEEHDTWISVAEAAALIGRSERLVRRMAAAGEIRRQRVGKRAWLVAQESVETVARKRAA
jgi:excisionase family DNA binding protein